MTFRLMLLAALVALASCAAPGTQSEPALPVALAGKAVVVQEDSPDYGRAGVTQAVQPSGSGGVSKGLVVRLTQDLPVFRLWSGPAILNAQGQTNRLGQWWSYDRPAGSRDSYRASYEICRNWNTLTWVASCTLKAGAVVVIGPGQSVSSATCATDGESYPENQDQWQTYVSKAWSRPQEFACPDQSEDYENDPADVSRPLKRP